MGRLLSKSFLTVLSKFFFVLLIFNILVNLVVTGGSVLAIQSEVQSSPVVLIDDGPGEAAQDEPNQVNLHLFYGDGCPHCANQKDFLKKINPDYPNLKVYLYEVYYNKDNLKLMQLLADKLKVSAGGVPFTVIGDRATVGFDKVELENNIKYFSINSHQDMVEQIKKDVDKTKDKQKKEEDKDKDAQKKEADPKIVDLPLIGRVDVMKYSLPALTVILGLIDGFNPCAMWALLFLISLLIGIGDRKRMWLLGSIFILVSGLVYFLFMAAWLNVILLLGFIIWVRLAIGLLAVGGGGYNIYSFFKHRKETGCQITASSKRQAVFDKMRQLSKSNKLYVAIGGIILLAFSVNLVELICSAGLPAIYTQVLTLSNLETWQYYGYILLYILFFMLDDLIVFSVAMFTLKITGLSTKYGKLSKIIGGILMLIIGLLLIFKPEILMFG